MYCIAIVLKAYSSIKSKCNLKIFHTILTENVAKRKESCLFSKQIILYTPFGKSSVPRDCKDHNLLSEQITFNSFAVRKTLICFLWIHPSLILFGVV